MSSPRTLHRRESLRAAADRAADFLDSLPDRPVAGTATPFEILRRLDRPLPQDGVSADTVIGELVHDVEPGLIASAGPRYFGFVVGGTTRAGLMADWLTSAWDQNAQVYATSPAAAAAEVVVARWLVELLGLPARSSVGFVTGCQMANFTALACARNVLLERAGWDAGARGLFGASSIAAFMSDCAHATVRSALAMLGIGSDQIHEIRSDDQGRMCHDALREAVGGAAGRPMVVSVQAGNVSTGAFEPIDAIARLVHGENAWIHVDGAFGLWAAASPRLGTHLRGLELADSWATDAHKWLNAPYDSGIVVVKDPAHHRSLKTGRCAYAGEEAEDRRDGSSWAPENSRRARAFVLYAVLRELGRTGVQALVERCCRLAERFAEGVAAIRGAEVLNEVVLNQVLVRLSPPDGRDEGDFHRAVAGRVQAEGRCWLGATTWKGRSALRVSICNGSTNEDDIALAIASLARAVQEVES